MNILTLDLATKTGWALRHETGIESGIQEFVLKRGESRGMRFIRFNAWLKAMMGEPCNPGLVVYEQAHHRGGPATELAVGMVTRVHEIAAANGIEYQSVHSATLKKFMTGNGRASKSDMIEAAKEKFPDQVVEDDNQADALALLHWAVTELRLE